MFGSIEGGGTKFVCAVGHAPDDLGDLERIPTGEPRETLAAVVDALRTLAAARGAPLAAVGLAMFGPVELDARRPAYGRVLRTPKPGWSGFDVRGGLARALGVPIALETDVNAAALAEARWGAAEDADPVVYLTVGTGIGGGVLVGGVPLHGLLHPEIGHLRVPRQRWPDGRLDEFPGICPFHHDCLEGLVAGPALQARRGGVPASSATADDPLWELTAAYLAQAVAACCYVVSPRRVVLGGGVLAQPELLGRVQRQVPAVLAGYLPRAELTAEVERFLVAPRFGATAGLIGAFALAQDAAATGQARA